MPFDVCQAEELLGDVGVDDVHGVSDLDTE
jgi:hypothetical protein